MKNLKENILENFDDEMAYQEDKEFIKKCGISLFDDEEED